MENQNKYDSSTDTLKHKLRMYQLMGESASELIRRGVKHDNSKLGIHEKELFDEYTPKLKHCTFGSEEYNEFLIKLKPSLDHHYENNSHHPQHYTNGINGFDLFDLMEMFFDWKASGERHHDGDIYKSIEINKDRFGISDQLETIFINTAKKLGY